MKKLLMCVLLVSRVYSEEYSAEEIRIAKCIVAFDEIRKAGTKSSIMLEGNLCNIYHAVLYKDGTYYLRPHYSRLNDNCSLTKADVWTNAQKYIKANKYCKHIKDANWDELSFVEMRLREYESVEKSIPKRKKKAMQEKIEKRKEERMQKLQEMVKEGAI